MVVPNFQRIYILNYGYTVSVLQMHCGCTWAYVESAALIVNDELSNYKLSFKYTVAIARILFSISRMQQLRRQLQ